MSSFVPRKTRSAVHVCRKGAVFGDLPVTLLSGKENYTRDCLVNDESTRMLSGLCA